MTHRIVVRCSCGHRDELISIYGKPSSEEVAAARRAPCIRCQHAAREQERFERTGKEPRP